MRSESDPPRDDPPRDDRPRDDRPRDDRPRDDRPRDDRLRADAAARAAAQEKHGRAGRDLSAAIAVGVTLVALVVVSLAFYKDAFAYIVAIVLLLAAIELTRALATAGIRLPLVPAAGGGLLLLWTSYFGDASWLLTVYGLTVLVIIVHRLPRGPENFLRDTTAAVFVLSYLFVMGTFALRLLDEPDGEWRVIAFIGCTIASDIGGYVAGVLFGKHPMAPSISPKKSWEGFTGSLTAGVVVGVVLVVLTLDGPWWVGVVLGAASVVVATLGDLGESLIKRDLGIKDMGTLLPGHGGIMDRLDSLIAVAPVSYLVMTTLL